MGRAAVACAPFQAPAEILMCLTTALEEMCNEAGTNATLRRQAQQRANEASAAAAAAAAAATSAADGSTGDAATPAPASPSTKKAAWEQAQMMSADSLMPIVIYCCTRACMGTMRAVMVVLTPWPLLP